MDTGTEGLQAKSTPAGDHSDRRLFPRYLLDVGVVARPTDDRNRVIYGRIVDLSCGGVSAVIAANLRLGEVLELQFWLPYAAAKGMLLEAAIRSRESYRYSLEFVHVIASDQEMINQTCAALALLH
jgi:PilZ domain